MIDIDDEEGPLPTAYVKTTHEMNLDEVEKTGPELKQLQLDELDEIKQFGSVVQFI
jgi:hypothetical protein